MREGTATLSAHDAVMAAHKRGDYQSALAATEGLKKSGQETPDYCFYQGALRRHLGQTAEAEQWLRKAIRMTPEGGWVALQTQALGETLLELGRYDEARQAFGESLQRAPQRGSSDRGIAETWLRQGEKYSDALRHAKAAVQKQRAMADAPAANLNLGEDLALLAWAVAMAEPDDARVTALAEEAVAVCPGEASAPSAAQVNFHLGCAYAALDRGEKSQSYFREAMHLDPQGHWGAAARRIRESVDDAG
jgi:tetratricopeptide (TPR) repeat protein